MLHETNAVHVALCLVGCLHLASFTALLTQSWYLYGRGGLQPVSAFLQLAAEQVLPKGSAYTQNLWTVFQSHPTLLWLHSLFGVPAATLLNVICTAGVVLSAAAACGVVQPWVFGLLWALYMSVVNVGQTFAPQPGDAILLEVTFACIWLAASRSKQCQTSSSCNAQIDELQDPPVAAGSQKNATGVEPALLFLRWLLFKWLLLSSISMATVVCAAVGDLASCYRAMLAQGQPHLLTWWLQAVPDVLGATVAAVSLLQGFCAFMLLCTAASVQMLAIRAVLCMQLIKLMCGSMALADGAGAVLCIFLLDETTVTAGLQRIRGVCTRRHTGTAAEGTVGPAGAELLSYKANGRHKRSHSADSLASLLTEYDAQPADSLSIQQQQTLLTSRGGQLTVALVAAVAAFLYSSGSNAQLVLRWTPVQITAALHILVPAAATVWLILMLHSIRWSCKNAAEMAAAAAAKVSHAAAQKGRATKTSAHAGPAANGLLASPVSLQPQPTPRSTMAEQDSKASAVVSLAPIATTATDTEAAKPARKGKAAAVKATSDSGTPKGTPRKGGRSKAAAAGDDSDAATDPTADETPKVARGRSGAASRGKRTSAAVTEAGQQGKDASGAAAAQELASPTDTPAAAAPVTPAVPSAPATVQKQATTPTAAVIQSAADRHFYTAKLLAAKLHACRAVMAAAVLLGMFLVGLPAVLLPAGYTHMTLGSVPGLLSSYQTARSYGVVSSDAILRSTLQPIAVAAKQQPGSYLVYDYSVSTDGEHWQPVQWKASFSPVTPRVAAVHGLYDSRLQGRLVAAGVGNLTADMWLLSVADKLLKGDSMLNAVLADPVSPREWVKIDLVRYTPSCLTANGTGNGTSVSNGRWVLQHVAEVLPAIKQGDEDLQEALSEFGWATMGVGFAHPGLLAQVPGQAVVFVLLLAVAFWHCFAPSGLLHASST